MIAIDREQLAWAAGFLDGEGGFYLSTNTDKYKKWTYYQVCSTVVQSGPEIPHPLARFHQAVGIGKILGPYPPKGMGHKPQWNWRITGFEKVQAVVALLWTWLSEPKREQARRALAGCVEHPNAGPKARAKANRRRQARLDYEAGVEEA